MNTSQTVTETEHGQMLQQGRGQVAGAHVRTRLQQGVSLETGIWPLEYNI